jgi:LAO/AO transport system kinase
MSEFTRDLALSITSNDGPLNRRVALSRAITLMESKNLQKKQQADYLLTHLLSQPRPKGQPPTLRIGIAGPPGAGKSSLVEAFGMYLLQKEEEPNKNKNKNTNDLQQQQQQQSLAVVCIDPSSGISGGSILGDKTRMTELSRQERAYVRPSANSGVLGGLAAYTDDVVTTLSAAGYPLVLVETVGLGQSEIEVAQSVDILILLLPPGGGDQLQGVKKGIIELAHIFAVTKADGNLLAAARSTAADYRGAISILQQNNRQESVWKPPVLLTSAKTREGLDELWTAIQDYREHLVTTGTFERRRQEQAKYWMWKQFTRMMQDRMRQDPKLAEAARQLESKVLQGHLTPRVAAQELLEDVFRLVSTTV